MELFASYDPCFYSLILIWIFDFGPEKLPGLSRNGPRDFRETGPRPLLTISSYNVARGGGGGGRDSHMEQTGMLVGNFEFNPYRRPSGRGSSFLWPLKETN